MTQKAGVLLRRLVPLLVVIAVAYTVAISVPVLSLVVPSTVFLSGLVGLLSTVYLYDKLQMNGGAKGVLSAVNFVLTMFIVFLALRALAEAVL